MIEKSHGSPYDRGRADSWYGRGINPHYIEKGDSKTVEHINNGIVAYATVTIWMDERIEPPKMTIQQIRDYLAGYDENEADPFARKDWT